MENSVSAIVPSRWARFQNLKKPNNQKKTQQHTFTIFITVYVGQTFQGAVKDISWRRKKESEDVSDEYR